MLRPTIALALLAGIAANPSWSQPYPTRPIRMLIPQPAGGTMDTIARMVSNQLVPVFGQNIVIDNRSGANGIIAGETLARAVPDGYTLLYTSASLANNQLVHKKLPFDALRDFAPITQVTALPGYLIVTNPQMPARTIKDLVELSRTARVLYGSSGVGNSQHLLGELLNSRAGARLAHVPFKGFALIVNAVLGNEIQILFGAPTTVVSHIKAGRMRAIAYTGAQRWSGMPELPTVAESLPGFVYEASWHGLFAPAATPPAVILKLQTEIAKVVHAPRMREQLESGGHVPIGSSAADFGKFLKAYFKDTAEQLRIAGVKPE